MKRVPFRHQAVLLGIVVLAALGVTAHETGWRNLLLTPDQRGRVLLGRGQAPAAGEAFHAPLWRGVAFFRAGDFKAAAQALGASDTAEGAFDQGNALVMLGQYEDAIRSYDRALTHRPGWSDAEINRRVAAVRAERKRAAGGETDDASSRPDEVVFDKSKRGGEHTTVQGNVPSMSDEAVRAMWLKRVQTRPADFLRSKFAYQLRSAEAGETTGAKP